jgi:hypothetical protein
MVAAGLWRPGMSPVDGEADESEPERDGIAASDSRWRVPWLRGLRKPPANATWPRLMTVPHPRATGSLGKAFIREVEARDGKSLRWWQQLVATRLLETDADGRLVWGTLVLSMSRQLGKSWFLRELCLWRMHQRPLFGEPQDVLFTGKDLAICKEVQRFGRAWAKARKDVYRVREANGQEEIELLADGSRWLVRAKGATEGYSVSLGIVDEGWAVKAEVVSEGLRPTLVERVDSQLVLSSTAHRAATPLMLGYRQQALETLESGDGDLLIEWSAPPGADLDDVSAWRQASPHWTPARQRDVEDALSQARSGHVWGDDEQDPLAAFNAQWLNQWPMQRVKPTGKNEDLLPAGLWLELAEPGVCCTGPIWVAVEDNWGQGAAVAAVGRLDDGRLEVDGRWFDDWDSAVDWARLLAGTFKVRQLLVGAAMVDRMPPGTVPSPIPAGGKETRVGLALFRDLALSGELVHYDTPDLDDALVSAQVRENATGLTLVPRGRIDLVKAAVWAVAAAHKPAPVPAIH